MMPPVTYSLRADGLYLHTDQGCIALTPYTPRTIRVRYTLSENFSASESLMVVARPDSDVHFEVREEPDCHPLLDRGTDG